MDVHLPVPWLVYHDCLFSPLAFCARDSSLSFRDLSTEFHVLSDGFGAQSQPP
jgi:hypothetical protein